MLASLMERWLDKRNQGKLLLHTSSENVMLRWGVNQNGGGSSLPQCCRIKAKRKTCDDKTDVYQVERSISAADDLSSDTCEYL